MCVVCMHAWCIHEAVKHKVKELLLFFLHAYISHCCVAAMKHHEQGNLYRKTFGGFMEQKHANRNSSGLTHIFISKLEVQRAHLEWHPKLTCQSLTLDRLLHQGHTSQSFPHSSSNRKPLRAIPPQSITVWVLGIKLRSSGLVAAASAHLAILLAF